MVRNALIPVVTLVMLQMPAIFGGAIVTEQIFRIPGIGSLLISSILANDTPRAPAPVASSGNGNGNGNGHSAANGEAGKGSLADRIRALQSRASRLPQAGRA